MDTQRVTQVVQALQASLLSASDLDRVLAYYAQQISDALCKAHLLQHGSLEEEDRVRLRTLAARTIARASMVKHQDALRRAKIVIRDLVDQSARLIATAAEFEDHSSKLLVQRALFELTRQIEANDPALVIVSVYEHGLDQPKATDPHRYCTAPTCGRGLWSAEERLSGKCAWHAETEEGR